MDLELENAAQRVCCSTVPYRTGRPSGEAFPCRLA